MIAQFWVLAVSGAALVRFVFLEWMPHLPGSNRLGLATAILSLNGVLAGLALSVRIRKWTSTRTSEYPTPIRSYRASWTQIAVVWIAGAGLISSWFLEVGFGAAATMFGFALVVMSIPATIPWMGGNKDTKFRAWMYGIFAYSYGFLILAAVLGAFAAVVASGPTRYALFSLFGIGIGLQLLASAAISLDRSDLNTPNKFRELRRKLMEPNSNLKNIESEYWLIVRAAHEDSHRPILDG